MYSFSNFYIFICLLRFLIKCAPKNWLSQHAKKYYQTTKIGEFWNPGMFLAIRSLLFCLYYDTISRNLVGCILECIIKIELILQNMFAIVITFISLQFCTLTISIIKKATTVTIKLPNIKDQRKRISKLICPIKSIWWMIDNAKN